MRPSAVMRYAVLLAVLASVTPVTAQEVSGVEHWVEHAGLKLYVWEKYLGNPAGKPVVILAHGSTTAGRESFDLQVPGKPSYSLMDVLAREGFDVFALDIRGFGRSTRPDGHMTTQEASEDLNAVIDAIVKLRGSQKMHLLGWSWSTRSTGGMSFPGSRFPPWCSVVGRASSPPSRRNELASRSPGRGSRSSIRMKAVATLCGWRIRRSLIRLSARLWGSTRVTPSRWSRVGRRGAYCYEAMGLVGLCGFVCAMLGFTGHMRNSTRPFCSGVFGIGWRSEFTHARLWTHDVPSTSLAIYATFMRSMSSARS